MQNKDGQIEKTHSISAGLDYAGIGPEHALLHDQKIVQYTSVNDQEALAAVKILAETEGIIPALESAHAVAYAIKIAPQLPINHNIVINISGRADKDLFIVAPEFDKKGWTEFLKNQK